MGIMFDHVIAKLHRRLAETDEDLARGVEQVGGDWQKAQSGQEEISSGDRTLLPLLH